METIPISQEPSEEQITAERNQLGLGNEWEFVPETNGFVKRGSVKIPAAVQAWYDKYNDHTR